MSSGIELVIIGKLTYYALVVYVLFFVGIFLAVRQKFKQRENDRKEDDQVDIDNESEVGSEGNDKTGHAKETTMGIAHSKAANDGNHIERVEFKKETSLDSAHEGGHVQIVQTCVIKKPNEEINYDIVHNFEHTDSGSSVRKRNKLISEKQHPKSQLGLVNGHEIGTEEHFLISHTEYAKTSNVSRDQIVDGETSTSTGKNANFATGETTSSTSFCSELKETENVSEFKTGEEVLSRGDESYGIVVQGSHIKSSVGNHLTFDPKIHCQDVGKLPFEAWNSTDDGNDGERSLFDRNRIDNVKELYNHTEKLSPSDEKGSLLPNCSFENEERDSSEVVSPDGSVSKPEQYTLFCLASSVVDKSFKDSFRELKLSRLQTDAGRCQVENTNHFVNFGTHAGTLSKQVITEAISDSLVRLRESKHETGDGTRFVEQGKVLTKSNIYMQSYSGNLAIDVVGKAFCHLESQNNRLLHKMKGRPGRSKRRGSSDLTMNKFSEGLAVSVQKCVFNSLESKSLPAKIAKRSLSTEDDALVDYSSSLAEEILLDGYTTIKVGQYARRMSETIAHSAYDCASIIMNSEKEKEIYFNELSEKVIHSALDGIRSVNDEDKSRTKENDISSVKWTDKVNDKAEAIANSVLGRSLAQVTHEIDQVDTTTKEISHFRGSPSYIDSKSGAWRDLDEKDRCFAQNGMDKNYPVDRNIPRARIQLESTSEVVDSSEDEIIDYVEKRQQKQLCKGDRPLSGYAEKLAELLAEEEDDLDFLDSEDELETTLDKIEEKYKSKQKISSEVARIRSISSTEDSCTSDDLSCSLRSLASEPSYTDDDLDTDVDTVATPDVFPEGPKAPPPVDYSREFSDQLDDLLRGTKAENKTMSPKGYYKTAAIIDAGCGVLKAGMAGRMGPDCIFPSIVGMPKRFSQDLSNLRHGSFVGPQALDRIGMLHTGYPIKPTISNWSDIHSIIEYTLDSELGVCDSEHPVLLTELALKDKKQREKMTEILFERLGVPAYFLSSQGPLTLYSMGLVTGLCLNSGFTVTQAEPVFEGYALHHATSELDIGGESIANYLGRLLLSTKGLAFNSSSEKRILNTIKEKVAYVAEDFAVEETRYAKQADAHEIFTLPDGQEIELGVERCACTEILFEPEMLGSTLPPLPHLITKSIASSDVDLRELLAKNVVVSGGNSLLPGFISRLGNEMRQLTHHTLNVKISQPSEPVIASWVGGSLIASLSTFNQEWVTLEEYAERGASIVQTRCF